MAGTGQSTSGATTLTALGNAYNSTPTIYTGGRQTEPVFQGGLDRLRRGLRSLPHPVLRARGVPGQRAADRRRREPAARRRSRRARRPG